MIKSPFCQIQGLSKGFVKTVDMPHYSVNEAHSEGLELNLCHLSISRTPSSLENDLVRGKPFALVVCPPLECLHQTISPHLPCTLYSYLLSEEMC